MNAVRRFLRYDYKKRLLHTSINCVTIDKLIGYVKKTLARKELKAIESHLAACYPCLDKVVSMHEGTKYFKKRRFQLKKENLYLMLAIVTFVLSFAMSRYFLQFLAATLMLGCKWIVESKTSRMLIMVYDAWKKDGVRGAGRALNEIETLERR